MNSWREPQLGPALVSPIIRRLPNKMEDFSPSDGKHFYPLVSCQQHTSYLQRHTRKLALAFSLSEAPKSKVQRSRTSQTFGLTTCVGLCLECVCFLLRSDSDDRHVSLQTNGEETELRSDKRPTSTIRHRETLELHSPFIHSINSLFVA